MAKPKNQYTHELGKEFNKNISSANDDEMKYTKNNLNRQISKVDNISKNLKELIENASEDKEIVIDKLSKSFKDLTWDKEFYTFNIEKEMGNRELHKLETFKALCLYIKLPRFKGYDSAMDIFFINEQLLRRSCSVII